MLERFRDSIFGTAATVGSAEPVAPVVEHPERRLLRLLGASNFQQIERDAEQRARLGIAPGRVIERRDPAGHIVDVRAKSYGSNLLAGCDYRLAAMEERVADAERDVRALAEGKSLTNPAAVTTAKAVLDARLAALLETVRLLPVARRWALFRDLDDLGAVRPLENAPQGLESRDQAARTDGSAHSSGAAGASFSENLRSLGEARVAAEASNRANEIRRFEDRAADKHRALMADAHIGEDTTADRARLQIAVREWHEQNPEIAGEIARARG